MSQVDLILNINVKVIVAARRHDLPIVTDIVKRALAAPGTKEMRTNSVALDLQTTVIKGGCQAE